ncbi:MAG: ATPase P [Candidatus Doudnabacteria bacterium RIFCSPLOWO2_02_FULL_49_13]|uniref:ATPase P n=1 Tax=Candidatus Doudnabacteria bacterium RIFCSPHIGHO2_12_FULL_48_16 TaxID=1817838 RepID=A0A1F5PKB0_9BACT|nr:MAG: ATPase P [Candidatus Doudnabacteria bacterium RIFCSPHIGHO2_02_FULL_49_24]OGE89239.1 MAG: ATPase P [Candidatus Doudnabacteria bacterium RIFCSPHIGHO2_01_FULL_50_67]OGE90102.1 MAG: ATPase P [Candidatus Doudnabacteria bacterium RIFCSPHIGHO2_12_FULL_48_16]OGE97133.1 MAG: ATPase P [Candidatus Doudnabacteria bacterium RIFCSPLOWO2_01_FULL_49_40]OGF03245.1 MAG: ATPase P [Candidatus Doudnabacteria bacterium RIFCSPLOWO2_02_FULL_49_13]OGF03575.1 MAG: ATPase P [Candidatus Doudnabacteria bacterium R
MDHSHHGHEMHAEPHNHDKHAGHSPEMFRDKFWWSLILTVPTLLYSGMIQDWFNFGMPEFPGSQNIPLIFGTILFFYSGTVFIKSAGAELRAARPGMMVLISQAIIVAFAYSVFSSLRGRDTEFFWELSTLITIMIFGHWMEMRSVMNAQGALKELAKLLPDMAELVDGRQIALSEIKIGDVMLVRPGAKVPADGIVVDGSSSVNESMITGESELIKKIKNQTVIAGTVNGNGSLKVQVTKIGDNTALAGIMRLVAEAQKSQSKAQILADRAAFYLTIIATISGAATLAAWLLLGRGGAFALERTVTVLVIACPHALGLAIPLVTSISTSLAAKNGLLIKKRIALESARNIDVVLFDKTGTLTRGEHGVVDIWPLVGSQQDLIRLAASVEAGSEHPIAKAIMAKAREFKLELFAAKDFSAVPGKGAQAVLNGKEYFVGRTQAAGELESKAALAGEEGKTVVFIREENKLLGALATADLIREESAQAIAELKAMGKRVAMLTGDSEAVAKYVAKKLGITRYFAQVLPEHKVDKVKELQKDGSRVAMVGDGVNDAPALAAADIGIAIGAGTDVAIESAGIILVKSDPRDIVKIVKLSKATYAKMSQNLVWATGYNVIAIPLAAGLLGIILPAAIGAILMSVSTVVVALNAQLLRKLDL